MEAFVKAASGQPIQSPYQLNDMAADAVGIVGLHEAGGRMAAEVAQGAGARVLYLDGAVIVIDKPAGVAVSRGRAGLPSVEDWLEGLRQGKRHAPQPAHRLDAETAGCLALGRTKPAMAALGASGAA